jgi:hypothetical protein
MSAGESLFFPGFERETNIQVLRIAMQDYRDPFEDDDDADCEANDTVLSFFNHIPLIKQISLLHGNATRDPFYSDIIAVLSSYRHLEDLAWQECVESPQSQISDEAGEVNGAERFPALRRLVLKMQDWTDIVSTVFCDGEACPLMLQVRRVDSHLHS